MDRHAWNERYEATDLVWTAGPNQTFADEVGGLEPGTALDLAAGEGRNAIWLATQGWTATAVDFSDVALDKARQLAEARDVEIETVVADVTTHVPTAGAYDLVAVIYLHLPADDRRLVHQRAAAAVAPGGTLIVLGHDTTNLTDGHGGPQDAAVLYTPDDVVTDLEGTGLTVTKAERVDRTVSTPDGDRTAIDALVVATR
ncbi:class I SAM-dependent methyltransferase [Acidimicrobiia bacterium EGI L10123]|uniref:class I SAM-dependent methyltransferase n=1 Tax=Salinilacustrithrix flava TaxID=2957203 RepID=UPI003D7C31AA|nr:class I SAM-dependent methyltransferase [Acidimicrobiia bacterium EGI L10123]